jgi:3-hydroxyisobutyrate dehydrogenase
MTNCAFIGLGVMGYPMAGHLQANGHDVTVYNRTTAKAEQWVAQHGGARASTPREAAAGQSIVFVCVGNDDDVRSVVLGDDGALAGMGSGTVLVDHTTASADLARELHEAAQAGGVGFVDAPVSGGQAGAENGALTVMCGGEQQPFDTAAPAIASFSQACNLIGGPGSGQLTKMVNQLSIAGLLQGLSEALAFGSQAGLDMDKVLDTIDKGAAGSWQMSNRGRTMVANEFDFGFAVEWMQKDLGIALDAARKLDSPAPVSEIVAAYYDDIAEAGHTRWDTSSLISRIQG